MFVLSYFQKGQTHAREQINNQLPIPPRRLTHDEIRLALDDSNEPWDRTWVRKGYANTILRLLALGWTPVVRTSLHA